MSVRRTLRIAFVFGIVSSLAAAVLDVIFCFDFFRSTGCADVFMLIFAAAALVLFVSIFGLGATFYTRWPNRREVAFFVAPALVFLMLSDAISPLWEWPFSHDVQEAFFALTFLWPIGAFLSVAARMAWRSRRRDGSQAGGTKHDGRG